MALANWIRPTNSYIVQKRDTGQHAIYGMNFGNPEAPPEPVLEFRTRFPIQSSNMIPLGAWAYTVVTFDVSSLATLFYVNGGQPESMFVLGPPDFSIQEPVDIGGVEGRDERGFRGSIDEVRISSVIRSTDWIAAQYLVMTDTFIIYGLDEKR